MTISMGPDKPEDGWQTIETAPLDGSLIIAWATGDLPYVSAWVFDRWLYNMSRRRSLMRPQPTHFLPLPPPPTPIGDRE